MTEEEALITLAHVLEPADPIGGAAVEHLGPRAAVEAIAAGRLAHRASVQLRERLLAVDPARSRRDAARIGARIITRGAADWPTQLDDLGITRPYALWVLGAADLRPSLLRSVSVVGARDASAYGEDVTRTWCASFVERGVTIVSGGAFGIDASAHRATLDADGLTICVLAGGVDRAYPRAHEHLIARIADEGLVVSESPLGAEPRRQRFLTRNRLIAAFTRATVIVEAAIRSGTTTTARAADALGRPVLAVPGPVTSPASAGCHDLIAAGVARLAGHAGAVLEALALPDRTPVAGQQARTHAHDALRPADADVLDAMPRRAIDVDALATRANLPVREVLASLGRLAASGHVVRAEAGWRLAPRA